MHSLPGLHVTQTELPSLSLPSQAVMLVVDLAGDAYPSIGHAAWDGLHLADFVMPYFLLISGISAALSPAAGLKCQLQLSKSASLPAKLLNSLAIRSQHSTWKSAQVHPMQRAEHSEFLTDSECRSGHCGAESRLQCLAGCSCGRCGSFL